MSLKIGTTSISDIYKGTTKIDAIYKGTILVYSAGYWLSYGFTYLYNSLVPTTIDGKNVLDKARIKKIYANGVIENQLSPDSNSGSVSDLTVTRDNGVFTINGTSGSAGHYIDNIINIISNHTYLLFAYVKNIPSQFSGDSSSGIQLYANNVINISKTANAVYSSNNGCVSALGTATGSGNANYRFRTSAGCVFTNTQVTPQLIDLTLMFGTGNEPTSLSDNRIQKILNGGYIAYNTGTYKGTDISEFSSESFNVWDEEWETGVFNTTTGVNTTGNGIRSVNYISVIPNFDYYCYKNSGGDLWAMFFDKNYNPITLATASDVYENVKKIGNKSFTTPSNAKYLRFYIAQLSTYNNDICINVSSLLNGTYKPHKSFSPLSFIYQGNGAINEHDTLEITKTEYVFTRNVFTKQLNNYTWTHDTNYSQWNRYYTTISDIKLPQDNSSLANLLCSSYPTRTITDMHATGGTGIGVAQTNGRTYIYSSTAPSTGTLTCELATPQVNRFPKKHLGYVDMGSLEWAYQSDSGRWYSNGIQSSVKAPTNNAQTPNIYTKDWFTKPYSDKQNGHIYLSTGGTIFVYTTDNINSPAGYLFYETESEVADIETKIGIEAGGTITSDSDVLPNVDFDIKCK